jgi:hypothetical protein
MLARLSPFPRARRPKMERPPSISPILINVALKAMAEQYRGLDGWAVVADELDQA